MKHGTKSARNKRIVRRVLDGDTLKAVGKANNLSANRVRLIFYETMYRMFGNKHHKRESWTKIKNTDLKSWRMAKYYILARLV